MDFKYEIAVTVSKASGLAPEEIITYIEIPPNTDMGDFAFPCFRLAKALRKAPPAIAQEISEKMEKPEFIKEIRIQGAYINFFVDKSFFAKTVLEKVLDEKENYGTSKEGSGKNIVLDYSSPNIAKPFHVGHLRSTVIGMAIYNIYKALGYNSIGINHLGDWGTQFGKLIVAYKKWGDKEKIEEGGIKELLRIYVKFHEEAEKDPSLEDDARAYFVKMQENDEEAIKLWKWFYEISLTEFEKVYKLMGIKFDAYTGESFYNDKMDAVVNELNEKGLLKEDQGAKIVDLSEFNMPPCLIIRSDGGTLYATRDITAAIYRKNTYDFEKCLYVTALGQNLHFSQVFKVIEKMGYDWSDRLIHVPFGLVSLPEGNMSTRKGNVIFLEDLLNEAVSKTLDIINQKNPELENKEEVAKQVGIGSVIFDDLYNGRIKDIVFSWERMLNFDGETGPYVQYTHARAGSVLRKAGEVDFSDTDYSLICDDAAVNVIKLLDTYNAKIKQAAEKYEPSVIARYLVDVSQAFNKFYHDNQILNCGDEKLMKARLLVVYAVKLVLKSGLELLGIEAPAKM